MKFSCRKQINAPVILITQILINGTWAWNEYGAMQRKGNKNEKICFTQEKSSHPYSDLFVRLWKINEQLLGGWR